jgi:hypothetical protein
VLIVVKNVKSPSSPILAGQSIAESVGLREEIHVEGNNLKIYS